MPSIYSLLRCAALAPVAMSWLACAHPEQDLHDCEAAPQGSAVDAHGSHSSCDLAEEAPAATLALGDSSDGSFDRHLEPGEGLLVRVRNHRAAELEVTLRAEVSSEAGASEYAAGSLLLEPMESAELNLPVAGLDLPAQLEDAAGNIRLRAFASDETGAQSELHGLQLAFHPTGEGWQVYDAAARDMHHDHGALSDRMRTQLQLVDEVAEHEVFVVAAHAQVVPHVKATQTAASTDDR